jgi:hypothetical protein
MKIVRHPALVLSGCALALAALGFAPGYDKFETIHDAVINHPQVTEAAVEPHLALALLVIGLAGLVVAWSRRAWVGLAWFVASAAWFATYVEAHLFDGMFDDRIQHTLWGAQAAGPFAFTLLFGSVAFGLVCLGLTVRDAARALRTEPASSAIRTLA